MGVRKVGKIRLKITRGLGYYNFMWLLQLQRCRCWCFQRIYTTNFLIAHKNEIKGFGTRTIWDETSSMWRVLYIFFFFLKSWPILCAGHAFNFRSHRFAVIFTPRTFEWSTTKQRSRLAAEICRLLYSIGLKFILVTWQSADYVLVSCENYETGKN